MYTTVASTTYIHVIKLSFGFQFQVSRYIWILLVILPGTTVASTVVQLVVYTLYLIHLAFLNMYCDFQERRVHVYNHMPPKFLV